MMDSKIQVTTGIIPNKKDFWQEQIKLWQASGLSRRSYCQEHSLIFSRFSYWKHKLRNPEPALKLLPIKLESVSASTQATLCSLHFKNGSELKIHNQVALATVISLLS